MRRIRIGIIGAGAATEWAILPTLSGPDTTLPPDIGAWWGRRPLSTSDIRYQAPARPDVVALCDPDSERAERVASSARIRAVYSDWRLMLREVPLDALICAASPLLAAEVMTGAGAAVKWLWIDGPPAPSSLAVSQLQKLLAGRSIRVWCVPSLRMAWAHRAASRAIERGRIGTITAFASRWPFPLVAPDVSTRTAYDSAHLSSSYAAFDLLLALATNRPETHDGNASAGATRGPFAEPSSPIPTLSSHGACVMASQNGSATSLLIRLAGGMQATSLFASAESWNAPWPRIEICGTQGRSLVCESGRKLWLHQPREATEFWEPPGLAPHVSVSNVLGIAENLKAFLAACVADSTEKSHTNNTANSVTDASLRSAFHALRLLEAAGQSLHDGNAVSVEPHPHNGALVEHFVTPESDELPLPSATTLTLPL